jgi:hypothetical protein
MMRESFPSPVLTIDTTITSSAHHVALGMKNGSVRLYSFNNEGNPKMSSFNIDGPISTVQLSPSGDKSNPHLLVSSMSGFACIYTDGIPRLLPPVADDNSPVLCIYGAPFPCESGTAIVVGTFAGNVLIFEGGTLNLLYKRCLSAPIHRFGIGDIDGDGVPELVVMTKQSMHVFRPQLKKEGKDFRASV